MASIKFDLGAKLDRQSIDNVAKQLAEAKKRLEHIIRIDGDDLIDEKDVLDQINKISKALEYSFNKSIDRLDTSQFKKAMKSLEIDVGQFGDKLERVVDVEGVGSFRNLTQEIKKTEVQIKHTKNSLDKAFDTFVKTGYWSLANQAVQSIGDSVQKAISYTKNLDNSLNNIRIVTGLSNVEMEKFAKTANSASKEIGRTTIDYTEGALLYLQQGKSMAESAELTKQTLIAANITGQDSSETAELLTAALNGYNLAAKDAVYVTDIFANVGAKSGSDFEELATGFSKVASMASTVGVTFEQLTSQIATISTVTREAPESIGNALKTVYSRMSQIKLQGSATDEDGVTMTYGNVERALSTIGLSVEDVNGNMRDMGEVIEEVGEKWTTLSRAQKSAVTDALAGTRQANKLISLFNQWPMYLEQLENAENSAGAAADQNEIRMDSLQTKINQLQSTLEELYSKLEIDELLEGGVSALTSMITKVNELVDAFGGIEGVITTVGIALAGVFGKQISQSIMQAKDGVLDLGKKIAVATGSVAIGEMSGLSEADMPDYTRKSRAAASLGEKDFEKYREKVNKETGLKSDIQRVKGQIDAQVEQLGLITGQKEQASQDIYLQGQKTTEIKKQIKLQQQQLADRERSLELAEKELAADSKNARIQQSVDSQKQKVKKSRKGLSNLENDLSESKRREKELSAEYAEIARRFGEGNDNIEKAEEGLSSLKEELESTGADLGEFDKKIDFLSKGQKMLGLAAGIGVAVSGVANSMKAYEKSAMDFDGQTEAITSGIASVSSGLLMLPGIIPKVIGGIGLLSTAFVKFARDNTGIGAVIKDNAAMLEQYQTSIENLTNKQNSLSKATANLTKIEALREGGVNIEEQEEYNALVSETAALEPSVVSYYDAYGNAVLKSREEIEKLNRSIDEQIDKTKASMSQNAGSFIAESAYMQTEGTKAKEKIQSEITELEEKLNQQFSDGSSQKAIQKTRDELDKLYVDMSDLQVKFDALGTNLQEGVINPFITGEEVFKEVGEELQGFIGGVFNAEEIQKGLDGLSKGGEKTTEELTRDSERYIKTYKEGLLEVGKVLAKLNQSSINGDAISKEIVGKLSGMPADLQKTLSQQLMLLSFGYDEEQLNGAIGDIAKFVDEKTGEVDTFGMVKYFVEDVGPAAKEALMKNISEGIREGLRMAEEEGVLDNRGMGGFLGDKLSKNLAQGIYQEKMKQDGDTGAYNEETGIYEYEYVYGEQARAGADELIGLLESEAIDYDAISELLASNRDLFDMFKTQLGEEAGIDEGWLGSRVNTGYEKGAKSLYDNLDEPEQDLEKVKAMNIAYSEQDILTNKIASNMADSIDGQKEMSELWNGMVGSTQELGEGGLFAIDMNEVSDGIDKLRDVYETMEETEGMTNATTEAFISLGEAEIEASNNATAIGEAFLDIEENMGELEFDRLVELTGSTKENIMSLAEAAKNGSVGAAQALQNEMGKVYAAMNKNNEDYFRSFVKVNRDKLKEIDRLTGLESGKYKTLAEYEVDLEVWKTNNIGKYIEWQYKTVNDALTDQVTNIGKAADTTMDYQGEQLNATSRTAAISTLLVARQAAIAAQQAGEGGGEAAANMIDAMAGVDEGAGVALAAVADNIRDKGTNFAGIIDYIDRQIAELQAGTDSPGDDLDLGGITVPSFDNFNFNAKPGVTDAPGYSASEDFGSNDDKGGAGSDGGGGGSDSGSGGEPETVEDIEEKLDVYKDVESALQEIAHLLTEQEDLERDLYGDAKVASMEKRLELLKEQAKWEQKRIEIAEQEMSKLQDSLSKEGVKFDEGSGLISNYNQLLQAEIDKVNAIADTNVEAKNAAIERYEKLKEAMEEYEEHLQTLQGAEEAYLEFQREQSALALETLDYKLKVELDETELERQTEEFLMKLGDGLGSTMEKFLNSSERLAGTLKLLTGAMSDIQSMQDHIVDVQNDPNLSPEDRLKELTESKEEMIKFYETALKYRQELEKIQQEAYKEAGKLLSEHLKEFEGVNKELKSLLDIIKLTGQMDNQELVGSIMDTQLSTYQNQLDAAIKSRDMLASKMAGLSEDSEQWKILREEVQKLDEEILKITNSSLKLLQEQLKYTVDNMMDDLEKSLTNNSTFDEVEKALKKQNEYQEEYLSTTEKILSISELQKKVQDEIEKTTDPKAKQQLQKFLDEELSSLKEKDKLTHYDMERAEKMLDITMRQIALDNARNNKTMMRLVRTSTGNWAYQYVADAEAVEEAQANLSESLADLLEFDQNRQEEVQDAMLESKKDFYDALEDIMKNALNGEYETQEEFNQAIADAEKEFNEEMQGLTESLNTANKNLSESTLAAILDAYKNNHESIGVLTEEEEAFFKKLADSTTDTWETVSDLLDSLNSDNADSFKDKYADIVSGDAEDLFNKLQGTYGDISSEWDNSVSDMITSNENLKEDVSTVVEGLKDAWGDYQDKVTDVMDQAGLDTDGMKDKVEQLGEEQENLAGKTDDLIGSIESELDAMDALSDSIGDILDDYDDLMDKVDEYIRSLDELIDKQQEAMGKDDSSVGTKPPTNGNNGSNSGKPDTSKPDTSKPGTPSLVKGSKVQVKSGRTWYYDSNGKEPTGPTSPYANKNLYIVNTSSNKYGFALGSSSNISSALGWVKKEDIVGFDTGGYTGSWGSKDGKMAMLHEKELILNKTDTKNILEAIKIIRSAISINTTALSNSGNSGSPMSQNVTINAEFPNVQTANEIEKAFENMGNMAAQYASRKIK